MNIPIIRLEIESMRAVVQQALMQHCAVIDANVQQSVERFFAEGNVARILNEEVQRNIQAALKEEVGNFFKWNGPGRAAVRQAVQEHMLKIYPEGGQ